MDVQFQYTTNGVWQTYKQGYTGNALASQDASFILNNGYWYDGNGGLHPVGSCAGIQIINTTPPLGPSLGLSNL